MHAVVTFITFYDEGSGDSLIFNSNTQQQLLVSSNLHTLLRTYIIAINRIPGTLHIRWRKWKCSLIYFDYMYNKAIRTYSLPVFRRLWCLSSTWYCHHSREWQIMMMIMMMMSPYMCWLWLFSSNKYTKKNVNTYIIYIYIKEHLRSAFTSF